MDKHRPQMIVHMCLLANAADTGPVVSQNSGVAMQQRCAAQHSAAQHSTAQRSTAQRSAAQHSTVQRSTAQHSTAQHSTAQHSTAQRVVCTSLSPDLSLTSEHLEASAGAQHCHGNEACTSFPSSNHSGAASTMQTVTDLTAQTVKQCLHV